LGAERYDVVIIGAGIHGAGIAQAAAARGHSVLLLEQHSPAFGTSSRSSKLIHGGLRYLETGQFALVRECLRERELLLKLAPELVRLVPFYIPVYRHTTRRPWQIRTGLSLYALLGGLSQHVRFTHVPRTQWGELDGLATRDLQAVYRYFDAQTDDAALTRAVLQSAQTLGATVKLPAEFLGATLQPECRVRYAHDGRTHECTAQVLINAAGPWVTDALKKVTPLPFIPAVDLVQGAHIVVDEVTRQGIYYVEAPRDRRAVFVMPWQGHTLIGTTETHYDGDPAAVHALPQEIDYLLETYHHYFPQARAAKLRETFAGLRVLPRADSSAFHRPRDTLLLCDHNTPPRLVSVVGGKLTAYRATAEKLLKLISPALPSRRAVADTRTLRLP
jgi:glycerol-3-phosphate dehydrogenase